ncbi:MAG: hypothetical protein KGD59_03035 [Candidatus Heimdallarchaeota archaeon]|nr:hypothetical protein [Candidatus Heimdallarchaeota archaeon]
MENLELDSDEQENQNNDFEEDNKSVIITIRCFKIIEDLTIFQPLLHDITLYLYGIIAIFTILMKLIGRSLNNLHEELMHTMFIAIIMIGIIIHFGVLKFKEFRLTKDLKRLKLKFAVPYIVLLLNVLLLLIPSLVFYKLDLIEIDQLKHEFIVANWEQCFFAIIIPFLMLKIFPYRMFYKKRSLTTRPVVFFITAILFASAHKFVYRYDFGAQISIFFFGIIVHTVGFYFPSASITIHYLYNTICDVRMG